MESFFADTEKDTSLSASEKLKRLLRSEKKAEKKAEKNSREIMTALHRSENRELQEALNILCVESLSPYITRILQQGYEQGEFTLKVSLESIQLILSASQFMLDSGLFNFTRSKRNQCLLALQHLLERTIGVPLNTLNFISNEIGDKSDESYE